MIVFLLLCILATIIAGPVGIAFVLGWYALLFVIAVVFAMMEKRSRA